MREIFYRVEPMQDLLKKDIKLAAMDVSNGESVVGAVKEILAATGHIDVLICNAGISPPPLPPPRPHFLLLPKLIPDISP